jgi:hypothetical protein
MKGTIMKTRYTLNILAAAVLGIALATPVMAEVATGANRTSRADYHAALATASANYKAAKAACTEPGRSACRKQARADWNKAIGDAREAHGWPAHTSGPRN